MSSSTYPIIILSNSNVEDAFSSTNTPDYIPASPDYSPASPGNTSSDPSEDLSKDLLASLAISPFHNDPYMKVMQAYSATNDESPIPPPRAPIAPPTILPLSPKRACFLSSSFTDSSAPPHVFEIGESSHKMHLERHEEQIETILNHLDELPLERIEHMKDKIEGLGNDREFYSRDTHRGYLGSPPIRYEETYRQDPMAPKRTPTSAALAMSQTAIRKLVADSVSAALEAQAATMADAKNTNR
ncbi:hypothetical protein Tco_0168870, partial [Tanacetum coccineum]